MSSEMIVIDKPVVQGSNGKAKVFTRHEVASLLLEFHDRALMPAYMHNLTERGLGIMRGQHTAVEAEQAQAQEDANMIALRRMVERLQKGGPLG